MPVRQRSCNCVMGWCGFDGHGFLDRRKGHSKQTQEVEQRVRCGSCAVSLGVRLLPFNISWKSENSVSKCKIEFPAPASIYSVGF